MTLAAASGCLEKMRIGSTAAEVPLDADLELFERGAGIGLKEGGDGGDKTVGAEAAHHAVFFNKSGLHGRKVIWRTDPFDGGDFPAHGIDGEHRAAISAFAVEDDRACPAGSGIANEFGPGQRRVEPVAKRA